MEQAGSITMEAGEALAFVENGGCGFGTVPSGDPLGGSMRVERDAFVAVPPFELLQRLAALHGAGRQGVPGREAAWQMFKELCSELRHLLLARESKQLQGVQLYSSVFNPHAAPAAQRELLVDLLHYQHKARSVEELVPQLEEGLVLHMLALLRQAGFRALQHDELVQLEEAAMENARYTRAIEVDWDVFDPSFLSSFYDKMARKAGSDTSTMPEFSRRVLVCWRGIAARDTEGYFRLQKLDRLLQWLISASGLGRLGDALRISPAVRPWAAPGEWQESANEIVRRQSGLRRAESRQKLGEEAHPGATYIRQSGIGESVGVADFFKKETVRELCFEELLLVYRPRAGVGKEGRPARESPAAAEPVHFQLYRSVPLKEFASVFPAKRSRWNFADWFYVCMATLWTVTLLFKLQHAWASSTYLDEAVLAVLFVFLPLLLRYANRVVLRLRSHSQAAKCGPPQLTTLNCNKAALRFICDEALHQELNMAIVALFVLHFPVSEPAVTLSQLRYEAEQVLFKACGIAGQFAFTDIARAVELLQRLGLVVTNPSITGAEEFVSVVALPLAKEAMRFALLDAISAEL